VSAARTSGSREDLAGVLATTRRQLAELTGRTIEAVTAVTADDGGWRMEVEVVELERVPASTSVLATYDVLADPRGNLREYHRVTRYYRNRADQEEQ
jgi:hypothetical protein